jgi:diguanylate cyclase (GGDEF)-like protein
MKTKRIITEQDVKNFFASSINSIEDAMGIFILNIKEETVIFDYKSVNLLRMDNFSSEIEYQFRHASFDGRFMDILSKCCISNITDSTEFNYTRNVDSMSYNYALKLEKIDETRIKIYIICFEKLLETEKQFSLFSDVIGSGTSMFIGSTWWTDYDRNSAYFYSSDKGPRLLGLKVNEDKLYNTREFQKVRDNARVVSEFYDESIKAEEDSFEQVKNNESDYFSGRTPAITTSDEILWVEAYGKCLIRYPNGKPRFIVAIDIYLSDIFEKTNQLAIIKNLINYGLVSSSIGVWYHQTHFLEGRYYFTESYQRLMSSKRRYKDGIVIELLDEQIAIMKSKGNGYEKYLYEFRKIHNSIYSDNVDKYHTIIPHQKDEDTLLWIDVRGNVIERDKEGNVILFVGVNVDVTESYKRSRELERLRIQNERLQLAETLAIKARNLMIWYFTENKINNERYIFGNSFFEEKLGVNRTKEGYISFNELKKTVVSDDEKSKKLAENLFKELGLVFQNKKDSVHKLLVKHRNLVTKEILYMEHSIEANMSTALENKRIIGGIIIEVTENIVYQEKIQYLANTDTLTGTKNRNYFENYVKEKLPPSYCFMIFDIDGLKLINDAFGHMEGDRVIIQLANFLKETCKNSLFISRVGGDEFAVLSEDVDQVNAAGRIKYLESKVIEYNKNSSIDLKVSIGGMMVNNNDISFEEAYLQAENIMYRKKLSARSSRKAKILESILETLNTKTEETKDHGERLSKLAVKTMQGLGLTRSDELEDMKLLAKVHDIGIVTTNNVILRKPGKLTEVEFEVVKKHCESGYKILRNLTESDTVCNGVLSHHERWDGKGYPQGLKGEEIPMMSRVISVVDAYDAITNDRVYRKKRTKEEAIKEIIRCSGTQFDPNIVKVFLKSCFDI